MIPTLLIHPEPAEREQHTLKIITSLGFHANHPDLMWFGPDEKLGVEQTKKIKNFLKLKPYQAKGQMIVIIAAENLTTDAQNVLLKTLEEHEDQVNLMLGAASEEQLLPTLLSRCQIKSLSINPTPEIETKYQKDIDKLLSSATEERFQFIEKIKDREELLPALLIYSRQKLLENPSSEIWIDFLKALMEAEKWATNNVNLRAILEYLMLKLPEN
ncbi:MAG: hypothetical protein PHQ59_04540 [Candidatus Daviesbacteria bacterium]|nr:hypothetical protein [Candidatus Daviesbacteria bacterium]